MQLVVASSRPSSLLDANAALSVRFAPGGGGAFAAAPATLGAGGDVDHQPPCRGGGVRALAQVLRAGEDIVVLWASG